MPTYSKEDLILRAYEIYRRERSPEIVDTANETLARLHRQIEEWDGSEEGASFYRDFLLGAGMDAISAKGMAGAAVNAQDFIRKMRDASKLFTDLLRVKKEPALTPSKIADVRFFEQVVNRQTYGSGRPKLYVNRFLLSVFIERMTTIADVGQLTKTAELLGINPKGVSVEKLQMQVRESVDDSLEILSVDEQWTPFTRAVIAFYIVEAAQELGYRPGR